MDPRSQFSLQLLQKLGAPLMRAMNAHDSGDPSGQKDAQVIAALLSETVKISITLSQAMNLKPEDGDADAIRVSLATIAGGLVADTYAVHGRVPNDMDAQRIAKSLESVLAFSDNFAPAAEHAPRLQTLDGTPPFLDPAQTGLYSINALLPAIAAVAEFSFGQQETKLIQDVADTLSQKSSAIREGLLGVDASAPEAKITELVILQTLAQIYASAHRAETNRLRTLPDEARSVEQSVQPVWDIFDRQMAMLDVLIASMNGDKISGGGRGGKGVKPAATAPAESEPAQPATPPPAKPAGSPMSFFKKP